MLKGSCLCNAVQYAIDGELGPIVMCHCQRCRKATPEVLRLRIGTLDTPIADKPTAHIFVASKAEWDEIHDDLPQYAERP